MRSKKYRRISGRKRQRRRMIAGTAAMVVIMAAATAVYWNLPNTKLGRYMNRASGYMEAAQYAEAKEAYEAVLEIDQTNELAYRGLADDYLAQDMQKEAEEILHEGYEKTGSEVLLQNYRATVLNDVVSAINAGTADWSTAGRCLDILEETPSDTDAVKLLTTLTPRLLQAEEVFDFYLEDKNGSSKDTTEYELVVERIMTLAQANAGTFLPVLESYLIPETQRILISLCSKDAYGRLLEKASALGVEEAGKMLACLDKQQQISDFFAPMFTEFENENFKAAKDFIVTDEFVAIRDSLIQGTMEYWKYNSYVSVNREAVELERTEDGWCFSYLTDDALVNPEGIIRILAVTMKDLGVQRSCIEYVPAYDPEHYYPHKEYEIVYWNTMVSGIATDNTNVVSRMNYRFAEKIYYETVMEANMIYDWGGKNESRKKE